jgi:integrase/recombinase XerD
MEHIRGDDRVRSRPLIVERFLEMLSVERGASANTIDAYARDLANFASFIYKRDRVLEAATTDDITSFVSLMVEEGLAASSRARRLSALKQFFRFLVADGIRSDDPSSMVGGPKREAALPKTLTVDEVDRLLMAARRKVEEAKNGHRAKALRLYCLLEILYATGMRVSELVALPRASLIGDERTLTIRGKGGRQRMVPINPAAQEALTLYLRERDAAVAVEAASSGAETAGEAGRHRAIARFTSCAASRFRQSYAGEGDRSARGSEASGARRHFDNPGLHASPRGPSPAHRNRAPSAQ